MAWTSQRSGSWARTSNNADSPWYDAGTQTAAASAPPDDTDITLAAGHAVLMDYDSSGLANGYRTVTITSHATTPAMLYWADGSSGYLLVKTGYNIVGTNAAAKGRLLANSDGVWGNTGALPYDHKAVILLSGTAKIDALYLDIAMRATHPTNWYVETYKTAYSCADQTTGVNTSTGVITFASAPPTAGTAVMIKSSGALPTGMWAQAIYYTRTVSGNTCKLALQNSDTQIVIPTGTGSGALTMYSGHTDTATKTVNVVQDVRSDTPWSTTAGHNRVVLVNHGPQNVDKQIDSLTTIAETTIGITAANVDSTQYPLARLWLVSRNVSIRSAGTTTSQAIVDFGAGTHTGVFDCEIVNTANAGTTLYGYGIKGGGTVDGSARNTMSGIIMAAQGINGGSSLVSGVIVADTSNDCIYGVETASRHYVTGTLAGALRGVGADSCYLDTTALIIGCTRAIEAFRVVCYGTIFGCSQAIVSYHQCSIYGDIFSVDIAAVGAADIFGDIIGCTTGVKQSARVFGRIAYCTFGVHALGAGAGNFFTVYLCGATLDNNTTDVNLNGGRLFGWNATLGSSPQVDGYKYATPSAQLTLCQIQDLGGVHEAIGVWTAGGYIKTNGSNIHELTAQDNRADTWMAVPFRAVSGQQVTVTVTDATLSAHTAWTDLPVFAIVDPAAPWKGTGELLDYETQAHDASAHTYTLTYTPDHDCELWFMVRAKGGNASGTGTEKLSFVFDIATGGSAAATTRAWASMG